MKTLLSPHVSLVGTQLIDSIASGPDDPKLVPFNKVNGRRHLLFPTPPRAIIETTVSKIDGPDH
jgi:hypothetical protein